jgi:FkbM family methyltransferase
MAFKELVKKIIPLGICEYSIRRHDYMRLGFSSQQASRIALHPEKYQKMCEARLNLIPSAILSSLRTCVDAGAHAGNWTGTLLDLFHPQRVIAVECEPRLVAPLKARFATNPLVSVFDAALAESEGVAEFHQLRHPAGSSLLNPRSEITREFQDNSWGVIGTVAVQTVSYDRLVAQEDEISILKLDIQGAEMRVLANSREGLQKTKTVILEVTFTSHYESDSGFPELHQLMARKGFGLYRLSPPYDRGARILYADAIYVREDILGKLAPDR